MTFLPSGGEQEVTDIAPQFHRSLAKPMLKPGVNHAVVPNGVYVEEGERNFLISGQRLREAVRRILIGLNGTRSYEDLRSAIPAPLQPVFDTLLVKLDSYDMLTEGPSGAIDQYGFHSGVIAYVQKATADWERCLIAWTNSRITIYGEPSISRSLARSLSEARAGSVRIVMQEVKDALSLVGPRSDDGLEGEILLSVDQDNTDLASQLLDGMAKRHVVTIPCLTISGNAVIGPDCHEGLQEWRHATNSLSLFDSGSPQTTIAILTAALAFEAFASHVAAFSHDLTRRFKRSRRVKIIRHDGTVTEHELMALSVSAIEKGRSPRRYRGADIADETVAPWFDDAFGPFEEIPIAGPAYPLAHEAIEVRGAGPSIATAKIDAWGISPAQAHERALTSAIARMMEMRVGHSATFGRSPIIVGRSNKTIEDDAAALAIASSEGFMAVHLPYRISIDELADEDGRMLARLARLYAGEFPTLWVRRSNLDRTAIVWARLGPWTAAVAGRDIDALIVEAVGDAVSALQHGSLPYRQQHWPWSMWREAGSNEVPELLTFSDPNADRLGASIGEPSSVTYEMLDDPVIPPGFIVGYCMVGSK